MLYVTYF